MPRRSRPLLQSSSFTASVRRTARIGTPAYETRRIPSGRMSAATWRLHAGSTSGQTWSRCPVRRSKFAAAHRRHWCGSHVAGGHRLFGQDTPGPSTDHPRATLQTCLDTKGCQMSALSTANRGPGNATCSRVTASCVRDPVGGAAQQGNHHSGSRRTQC